MSHSILEHSTEVPVRPVESTDDTKYVNGDTRFMKIQKRGISEDFASTLEIQSELLPINYQIPADSLPVEDQAKREHELSNVAAGIGLFNSSNHHRTECRREHHELQNEQVHDAASFDDCIRGLCIVIKSDWVVPAEKDWHRH